jgi:hypothetical protein
MKVNAKLLTKKFLLLAKYKKIHEKAEFVNVRSGKFEAFINLKYPQ